MLYYFIAEQQIKSGKKRENVQIGSHGMDGVTANHRYKKNRMKLCNK